MAKSFLLLILVMIPLLVCASEKVQKLHHGDETWIVYLNDQKSLVVTGAWGEEAALIDNMVDEFWAVANGFGPIVLYLKDDNVIWQTVNGETGEMAAHGVLLETNPDIGFVDWITVTPVENGAFVKVVLDSGRFIVYKVNRHGWQHIVRQGPIKVPQPFK